MKYLNTYVGLLFFFIFFKIPTSEKKNEKRKKFGVEDGWRY